MIVEHKDKCGDFDGPVLDILPGNTREAFDLGRIFEKIAFKNKCAWYLDVGIRIPLIDMDEIGLAVLPKAKPK